MRTSALGFPVYPLSHCHGVSCTLCPLVSFNNFNFFFFAQKHCFYRRKGCCMLFAQIQWFQVKLGIFGKTYHKIFATITATLHILWVHNAPGNFSSKDSSFPLTIQLWKAKLSSQNFGFHRSFKFIKICILYHTLYGFSLTVQGNDWQIINR